MKQTRVFCVEQNNDVLQLRHAFGNSVMMFSLKELAE